MNALATQRIQSPHAFRHASEEEYAAFLEHYVTTKTHTWSQLRHYRRFVECYPDLHNWFDAPLIERVGRRYGEEEPLSAYLASYSARPYLLFLAIRGSIQLDWEWLIAIPRLYIYELLNHLHLDVGVEKLCAEAISLGYEKRSSLDAMRWILPRIFLHTNDPLVEHVSDAVVSEGIEAVRRFGERSDIALFAESAEYYRRVVRKRHLIHFHCLQVILYHRGQGSTPPQRMAPLYAERPVLKPRMEAVVSRYLVTRSLTDAPTTVKSLDLALRQFIAWIAKGHPEIETFAEVTRDHLIEYAEALNSHLGKRTKQPLSTTSKRSALARVSVFFRDVALWQWEEVPQHPLLQAGDLPKLPQRIPRYIPKEELQRLMAAIRELPCPYQRTALLIARWSGARRGEIRRLSIDCLDSYPDGSPRLKIPAGKTKKERVIPLNEEAADAIRSLQAQRSAQRGLLDPQTGKLTHYLFVRYGKLLSTCYLFRLSLREACTKAGLVTPDGKATMSPHRFRHTVGTQLAEKGAKLRTIMHVLGHTSASMSMVYAQISDPEVRQDYQAVLGSDAIIAGPGAQLVRSGELGESEIRWIKEHYFQTELELGRCLRLPQEGPCECDLYLTCAKFVTSPEYAPRLRRRRRIEQELVEDARTQSWQREVERHQCTIRRLEQLLTELGESIEGPEAPD